MLPKAELSSLRDVLPIPKAELRNLSALLVIPAIMLSVPVPALNSGVAE